MNKLIRWDPFTEMRALQKQFFGDDWFTQSRGATIPTTDVFMDDKSQLVVEAHLPNFDQKDISIQMEDGALVISAEKHEREEDKKKHYVVRESSSSFYRRIQLPERAMESGIKAKMDGGVLKVTVPIKEVPAPKRIAIEKNAK